MAATKRPVVKRSDPKPSPLDPTEAILTLKNEHPDVKYVWVPLHGEIDVDYYEARGFEKIMWSKDGPMPHACGSGDRNGPIVKNNHVLMGCEKSYYNEKVYQPGQDKMTVLERQIYDKKFARREVADIEGMRAMVGEEQIDFINETSPLTPGV